MQRQLLGPVILILIICINVLAEDKKHSDEKHIVIFEGQLIKGWHTSGWGGANLQLQSLKGRKSKVLLLKISESPKNWAGALLSTIKPTGKTQSEITLTPALKKSGTLVLQLNGSEDEWGNHVGNQNLQINIAQRTGKKKWVYGLKRYLKLKSFISGGLIDSNPKTWQEVCIPLSKLLVKQDIPALGAIFIQYIGTPTGPVAIGSIYIEP